MSDPFTSPWWLEKLGRELDERAQNMKILDAYYNGKPPRRFTSRIQPAEPDEDRFSSFNANICKPIVQALEERLTVEGFRFGDEPGNRKAWRIWQANQLDANSQKAHREAIVKGDCPVIIQPPVTAGGNPIIRIQKPEEVVVAYEDDPLIRAVAMKRWKSLDGRTLATLYYPDRIEKYEADGEVWRIRRVAGEGWPLPNPLGVVPVVALVNDPDLDNRGASELSPILSLQDSLDELWRQLLTSSYYAAFRQRWATGLEIPLDPETKKPIEPFKAAVERIWSTAASDAKFGDFDQTDVTGMLKAIEEVYQEAAAVSRTPYHYFLQHSGQPPSGESLKSSETGLVAKAKRRQRDFGEGWEEIERLAFISVGDTKRATFVGAETRWKDPEYRTEAEHVDALVKLASIGIPEEQLWEDAGYTPTQIERMKKMPKSGTPVPVTVERREPITATTTAPQPIAESA